MVRSTGVCQHAAVGLQWRSCDPVHVWSLAQVDSQQYQGMVSTGKRLQQGTVPDLSYSATMTLLLSLVLSTHLPCFCFYTIAVAFVYSSSLLQSWELSCRHNTERIMAELVSLLPHLIDCHPVPCRDKVRLLFNIFKGGTGGSDQTGKFASLSSFRDILACCGHTDVYLFVFLL